MPKPVTAEIRRILAKLGAYKRRLVALLITVLIFANCAHITNCLAGGAQTFFPGAIYKVDTDSRKIALTIDDVPDPQTTRQILTVLRQYNVRATFFVMSDGAEAHPEIIRDIVADGHELGHHMTADEPSYKLSPENFAGKFQRADSLLASFQQPRWFRPGSGFYRRWMTNHVESYDRPYQMALGSVYPYDTIIPSVRFALTYIRLNVKPGAIVILHDGGSRGQRTAKTLAVLLPELLCKGYQIVSLSDLYAARKR